MSQAVWTGSINFGLVTIPVKLYPATEPKDVRFHLYDRRTGKRVRYQRVTRDEEAPVFEPETTADLERDEPSEPWPSGPGQPPPPAGSFVSAQTVDPADVVKGLDLSADGIVTVTDDDQGVGIGMAIQSSSGRSTWLFPDPQGWAGDLRWCAATWRVRLP